MLQVFVHAGMDIKTLTLNLSLTLLTAKWQISAPCDEVHNTLTLPYYCDVNDVLVCSRVPLQPSMLLLACFPFNLYLHIL